MTSRELQALQADLQSTEGDGLLQHLASREGNMERGSRVNMERERRKRAKRVSINPGYLSEEDAAYLRAIQSESEQEEIEEPPEEYDSQYLTDVEDDDDDDSSGDEGHPSSGSSSASSNSSASSSSDSESENSQPESEGGSEFEGTSSDPSSSEDEEDQNPRPRRRRRFQTALSEDDPDSPNEADPHYDPDKEGWSRNRTHLRFRPFTGGPSGPAFDTEDLEPVDFFLKIFTLATLRQIVIWTNVALLAAGLHETNIYELRAFFGILILMGLNNLNSVEAYWCTKPGLRNPLIATTMRRKRFYSLSKHLRCTNPADNPDGWPRNTSEEKKHYHRHIRKHPLYPLQEVWDSVLDRCQSVFRCGRNLAIDEAMVRYKGSKSAVKKFRIPSKPIRTGFKIYALCDCASYFMCNFMVHPQKVSTMYTISKEIIRPMFGKFHHVFCDRLYTSVPLARKLLTKKTYLTGSIMTNRKLLPLELSTSSKNRRAKAIKTMKKTSRGTMYFRQSGPLTFVHCHQATKPSEIKPVTSSADVFP